MRRIRIAIYLIVGAILIYETPTLCNALSDEFIYTPTDRKLDKLTEANNQAAMELVKAKKRIR